MTDADFSFVDFTEAITWKLFAGFLPMDISPEQLSVAILESCTPFHGCSAEIKKYFLLRLTPMIHYRQMMQADAWECDRGTDWKA